MPRPSNSAYNRDHRHDMLSYRRQVLYQLKTFMNFELSKSNMVHWERMALAGADQAARLHSQRPLSDDESSTSSTNTSISLLSPDLKSSQLLDARSGLERLLDLRQTAEDTFVSTGELFSPYRSGSAGSGLFGGTMAAQATLAALRYTNTQEKRWKPISLHCHFLHAAKTTPALCYKVLPLKEGKNYCTREVSLYQNERLIYKAMLTLQACQLEGSASNMEGQLDHQSKAPVVGVDIQHPDEMYTQSDLFRIWSKRAMNIPHLEYLKGEKAEEEIIKCYEREPFTWRLPLDMFELEKVSEAERAKDPAERVLRYWVKTKEKLSEPHVFNWVSLAYVSDYFFLSTNMRLNMREMFTTKFSVSLDHTIYFNDEIDTSEFFSYNVRSIKSGENRSIMKGEMFSYTGQLAATTVQEGLSVVYTD